MLFWFVYLCSFCSSRDYDIVLERAYSHVWLSPNFDTE